MLEMINELERSYYVPLGVGHREACEEKTMLRILTRAELKRVMGGLCSYDTDSNPFNDGGGGGGDQPPSDPPAGGDDTGDDYTYSAFFDDEMDAVDDGATGFTYYIPVEESPPAGQGGTGDNRGYDSADYNGPESAYIDYFATQHGPESIEVRAAISAGAFFNYAQRQDQIRADLTEIVKQAPDAATANQRMTAYLASAGLGGQLDAQISDTGFAAAKQSVQQPDSGTADDIIVNGTRYRVSVPNTITSFGSEGQFMLASYMPSDVGSAQVYGSIDGVPASKKYPSQYVLPKHMTNAQKAAVVYNETKGIEDPNDRQMVAAMIMQVIANNEGRSFLAASPLAVVSGPAQQAAWNDAVNALQQYSNILASRYDMSSPIAEANLFVMRPTYSMAPGGPGKQPLPVLEIYGPFNDASTSNHYIRFFKDPAYAH